MASACSKTPGSAREPSLEPKTPSPAITAPYVDAPQPDGARVIGYFTNWAHQRPEPCAFRTSDIDTSLLTHVNYAFAFVSPGLNTREDGGRPTYELEPSSADDIPRLYGELAALKQKNPKLQTLLSVGGWTHNDPPMEWIFSAMARTPETRGHFIRHAIDYTRRHGFDGVDLDWEYPAALDRGGSPEDTPNFTALLREFRAQIHEEARVTGRAALLLTIAAPAGTASIAHYELSKIHGALDWINVMTYDYNGEWSEATGANAPLRSSGESIERTIAAYVAAGVPRTKIVLGMPTYARGWSEADGTAPGSKATGKAPSGVCGPDSLRSHEVAAWVKSGRMQGAWDEVSQTPYAFNEVERTWISYEDARSYASKIRFLREQELGGAMFWAIDLDDFKQGYPLIAQVSSAMLKTSPAAEAALQPAGEAPTRADAAAH